MTVDLAGYVDVATRITQLRDKHPEASLQPLNPEQPYEIVTLGDQLGIIYVAACYRFPGDPRPGIGSAWEPVPGRTPYTRGSELMVAETSAWGRAIVAALAADTRSGIASADEVAAAAGAEPRQTRQERPQHEQPRPEQSSQPRPATDRQKGAVRAMSKKLGKLPPIGIETLTAGEASDLIQQLNAELESIAGEP